MPVNKSAKFRYDIIDECLRNTTRKWTKNALLNFVNRRLSLHYGETQTISVSQIRYDLLNMQTYFGAPIEMRKEGRSCIYYYEDCDYSINNIPLKKEDIETLNGAILLLQQIKGFNVVQEIENIIHKLEAKADIKPDIKNSQIQFSNAPNEVISETIEDLFQGILHKYTLKVEYISSTNINLVIQPHILKEYNGKWFLLAHCKENDNLRLLEVDKMKKISVVNEQLQTLDESKIYSYFDDCIGVTKPSNKVENIMLLLEKDLANEILDKPIHKSQKIIRKYKNGNAIISIDVIINFELKEKLLGMGAHVTVLGPDNLAKELYTTIKNMGLIYTNKRRIIKTYG